VIPVISTRILNHLAEPVKKDWVYIKTRLELYEKLSQDVVTSALGLLSLVESHKSVEEAESARIIALLGTFYLPLSLTAGILSMGGNFIPGAGKFWVFPVVAGPMTLLSFFLVIWAPKLIHNLQS
jgi:Mg2+ and Co2+ transporter CorA